MKPHIKIIKINGMGWQRKLHYAESLTHDGWGTTVNVQMQQLLELLQFLGRDAAHGGGFTVEVKP